MGNLTRDPELRVTPKGTPICQFSLAINREWKTETGEKQEEVTYIDCECWGKQGEVIAKYVTKGRPLFVAGRVKQDLWEDKATKEKRSKLKVVVESFQFLGDAKANGGAPAQQSPERHTAPPLGGRSPAKTAGDLDADVPFGPASIA
jgi:single-strand DNA-binding protein